MESFIGYIGTNTVGKDGGIRVVRADSATGQLTVIQKLNNFDEACYFAVSPRRRLLVSARSNPAALSPYKGMVSTTRILADGTLAPINAIPAVSRKSPCHICVSPDGHFVYASHYMEGRATVFGIDEYGAVWGPIQVVQFEGSGFNLRQKSPHIHFGCFTPDGKYVCLVDLGLDTIHVFETNEDGLLVNREDVPVVPGAGARHMVFSRDGSYCWVVSEMGCLATGFAYSDGNFKQIGTVPIFGGDIASEKMSASAIRISPDGKLLFAGNRFVNNIAVFKIHPNGAVTRTANVPCPFPRDMNILPDGRFLYVCGEEENCVAVYGIDYDKATVYPTGEKLTLNLATCIEFPEI